MNINPKTAVKNELLKVQELKNLLENSDALYDENGDIDEKILLDMIEGETDIHNMLLEIENQIAEYDMTVDAIKLRIESLSKRKSRMEKSSATLRTIILSAMDKSGIKTIKGDLSTITIKNKKRGLVIEDESSIPSDFFKVETKLDKKKLLDAINNGEDINGATLDNGGISLQIRRT